MTETAEYYRGAIDALISASNILTGQGASKMPNKDRPITMEDVQREIHQILNSYRGSARSLLCATQSQLRALSPPAIAAGDVAIGADVEVAGLSVTGWPSLPDETMQFIFGIMPWTSASYARLLRANGVDVPRKCEMEQAYTIHWMLGHYLKHGPDKWREFAGEEVKSALALIAQAKEAGR